MTLLQHAYASTSLPAGRSNETQGEPASRTERELFACQDLRTEFDIELETLWTYMDQKVRPSFNPALLAQFGAWQDDIDEAASSGGLPIKYVVLGSRFPGIFSLGGDLDLFAAHIRGGDREALRRYGDACVQILHRNMLSLGQPIVTIALVEGDALGGGFDRPDIASPAQGTKDIHG